MGTRLLKHRQVLTDAGEFEARQTRAQPGGLDVVDGPAANRAVTGVLLAPGRAQESGRGPKRQVRDG